MGQPAFYEVAAQVLPIIFIAGFLEVSARKGELGRATSPREYVTRLAGLMAFAILILLAESAALRAVFRGKGKTADRDLVIIGLLFGAFYVTVLFSERISQALEPEGWRGRDHDWPRRVFTGVFTAAFLIYLLTR